MSVACADVCLRRLESRLGARADQGGGGDGGGDGGGAAEVGAGGEASTRLLQAVAVLPLALAAELGAFCVRCGAGGWEQGGQGGSQKARRRAVPLACRSLRTLGLVADWVCARGGAALQACGLARVSEVQAALVAFNRLRAQLEAAAAGTRLRGAGSGSAGTRLCAGCFDPMAGCTLLTPAEGVHRGENRRLRVLYTAQTPRVADVLRPGVGCAGDGCSAVTDAVARLVLRQLDEATAALGAREERAGSKRRRVG